MTLSGEGKVHGTGDEDLYLSVYLGADISKDSQNPLRPDETVDVRILEEFDVVAVGRDGSIEALVEEVAVDG